MASKISALNAATPATTDLLYLVDNTAGVFSSKKATVDAIQTFVLTDGLVVTALTFPNTGLHILDTDASHDLIISPGSNLSADHTLTITTGDADRVFTIEANSLINQDLTTDSATVVFRNTVIGGASSLPDSPDGVVHIHNASAGTVNAVGSAHLVIENNNDVNIQFLTPNTTESGIMFGDADSNSRAQLRYTHSSDQFELLAGSDRLFQVTNNTGAHRTGFNSAVSIWHEHENSSGGRHERISKRQQVTLSGASTDTTINIPSGSLLLGAQFNVDEVVVDSAGDDTWSAAFTGGSSTSLVSGVAPALNTKANKLIVPEITSAQTNVRFTPNGGNFTTGKIDVIVYYEYFATNMNNA